MSRNEQMRPLKFKRGVLKYPEGSCLIEMGETMVLVTATVEDKVPPFLEGTGKGWVTAEYNMLPRSNKNRKRREIHGGRPDGRGMEIQRLIGRALRTCIDRELLGERTITIDCDVLQADGGTRTAAINGGFVALYDACRQMVRKGILSVNPIRFHLGAVSVGKVGGAYILDLCYAEDSKADVDMNVVQNDKGEYIELQGTGEEAVFDEGDLESILALARIGIKEVIEKQKEVLIEDPAGHL